MCKWYNIGLGVENQYIMRLLKLIDLVKYTPTHIYLYTDLLQAAGTPAGDAAERPYETDDFPVRAVLDLHVEAAQRAAAVPGAAVILLFGLVNLLTQTVLYLVLVVGLKTNECWAGLENGEGGGGKKTGGNGE